LSLVLALFVGGILIRYDLLKLSTLVCLFVLTAIIGANLVSQFPASSSLLPDRNGFLVRESALIVGYHSWLSNPLFGSGAGSFEDEYLRVAESMPDKKFILHKPARSLSAHNSFLRSVVENGIFALAAFLWLLFSMIASVWKKKGNDSHHRTCFLVGILAFVISAVFEDIFSYSVLWALFWSVTVLALGNDEPARSEGC